MDYTIESSYNMYLINELREQDKMNRYIQECLILAEGKSQFKKLRYLNEDVGDRIRERWEKFTGFIKRIWSKFVENITRVMNTDVGYLEKYKDIILSKKLKEVTITMREYNIGLQRIANRSVPIFSTNLLNDINIKDDTDTRFKKKLIPEYDGKSEFADFCKVYFQGGEDEKDFNEHSINMTDLYNFCKDHKKIMSNIEKDQKTLINSTNIALRDLSIRLKDLKAAEQKPTETQPQQPTQQQSNQPQQQQSNQPQQQQQSNTQNASYLFSGPITYSAIYETYLTEIEIKSPAQAKIDNNNKTASSSGGTSSLASNSNKSIDKTHDTDNKATSDAKLGAEEINSLEQKISAYQSDCSTVLTAKMTAVTIIYKDYMKIIKNHVSGYVGTDASKGNTVAKAGTNYSTKLNELNNAQRKQLIDLINAAEQEQDEEKKLDAHKAVIAKARSFDANFKGGYEAAKDYAGLKSQQ